MNSNLQQIVQSLTLLDVKLELLKKEIELEKMKLTILHLYSKL